LEKYDADIVQLVAVTAEFLVDSIDGLTESGKIKKEFVGIILLPIVGNAAGTQISSHTHVVPRIDCLCRTRHRRYRFG